MNKNTPTPWEKHTEESNGGAKYWEIRGREPMPGNQNFVTSLWSEENADLIINAVNSHEELLAACKAALNLFTNPEIGPDDVMPLAKIERQLIDAITRAE